MPGEAAIHPVVYVVTPVHNRRELTRRFLLSMQEQSYPDVRVTIVDDGSTDGTREMIAAEFPDVKVLRGDGNLWWTGATNLGLRSVLQTASDSDFVLVINDDLEVDADYVEKLVGYALKHPRTLVGSVVVDVDRPDIVWDGGRITDWYTAKGSTLNEGKTLSEFPPNAAFEVDQLTGRGTLAPVDVFREVGLYDAVHFPHRGDTEFPVRAALSGWKQVVYYGAVVRSHTEMTFKSDTREAYRLSDFHKYFLDFRSSGWIKFRYYFALKTRRSPLQFVSFLVCDLARVSVHFFRRVRLT